ncbi:MAG: tetratricopeptide repeat protein [bacterium]
MPKASKLVLLSWIVLSAGCAYFNTFYNAQNYFHQGMKTVTNDTLKFDSELFDKTIEKCASVIVKYPESRYVDDALFMMGASYYYKGDYVRALEKLDFLVTNFPGSKFYDDAMYYMGLAYYKSEKFSKAIIAFKESGRFKYFRKKANTMLCYAYYRDRNYADLMNTANLLLKEKLSRKEKLMILNILSEAEYAVKDFDSALKTYNEIIPLEQNADEKKKIKIKIASVYLDMNEFEKCKSFLENEYDPEFRLLLAELNFRMNNVEEAKHIYLEIKEVNLQDYSAKAYYALGQIAEKEDSAELAIAYYDSLTTKATGDLLIKAKARSEILKKILDLTNKTEELDKAQFSLGELYFVELNDIPKAMAHYENVYKSYPKSELSPKALYANFWISKIILKQDSLAQVFGDELKKRYPDTEYAKSVLKLLEQQ